MPLRLLGRPEVGCNSGYDLAPFLSADCGYIGTRAGASELAMLIHGSLGNPAGLVPANSGPFMPIPEGFAWLDQSYDGDVENARQVLSVEGWLLRDSFLPSWPPSLAWAYNNWLGFQGPGLVSSQGYAWAVHGGDVLPIPEPDAVPLILAGGLLMLGWLSFRPTSREPSTARRRASARAARPYLGAARRTPPGPLPSTPASPGP
jgi:hypothetical protein